jgi:hypothetical protein
METFISWSGPRSRMAAEALRKWLPGIVQSVEPWVSGADIEAGARWHQALSVRLNQCNFGVICLTPENVQSPWLLYEAGALSKSVEGSSVVPYLLGLRKADVAGPLAHFQSVEADLEGTFALLQAINAVIARLGERPLSDEVLRRAFELWWPQLNEWLQSALALVVPSSKPAEARNSEEMLHELVENTRSIANVVESIAERLEPPSQQRPTQQKPFTAEPEVLEATRAALSKLVDDVDSDIPGGNVAMEQAVAGWREIASTPHSTLEALNEALRNAKGLRAYLDR